MDPELSDAAQEYYPLEWSRTNSNKRNYKVLILSHAISWEDIEKEYQ